MMISAVQANSHPQTWGTEQLLDLYRAMVTARQIDIVEQEVTRRGEAFFQMSGCGHEGTAVLASLLQDDDWLLYHYRDKALLVALGVEPRAFFDGLYTKEASHTCGRQISCHSFSDPTLNLMSAPTPVGNAALHTVGVASVIKQHDSRAIVVHSIGEGATQEGEFLEACAEAVRDELPLLFLVQDNGLAISTQTRGRTFFSRPDGDAQSFYGMPITRIDGRRPIPARSSLSEAVREIRQNRRPQVVLFEVERLSSHTNADDETVYRDADELRRIRETGDPIRNLEATLLALRCSETTLAQIRQEVEVQVTEAEAVAYAGADPKPEQQAKIPLPTNLTDRSRECRGQSDGPQVTMREAVRNVLQHQMLTNEDIVLLGEDIEDPKGDVFGVTRGLSTQFPDRVRNSALSESTIVGTSIGQALAGKQPVAFIQFADFLPVAFNQIASELGSMHWRSNGRWQTPVILMVACGAYRPGLGPFHAATHEAIMAHTPGLDVFMPSNAADAAGLLNAAFASGRPTVFLYPKTLINEPSETTSSDVDEHFIPIGAARRVRTGRDITFVAWGNTVRICQKAAQSLETVGITADLLDLRTLSPWDRDTVLASAEKTGRLLVVHEDNHTCGFGAEVLATVAEHAASPIVMRRIARADTLIPCHFESQLEILPSFKRVLTVAAEMLDLTLEWKNTAPPEPGISLIEAVGSGPADESVIVSELFIQAGQEIVPGDVVAALEATKSVFELTSSVRGVIEEICVTEGDTVMVGAALARVRTADSEQRRRPVVQDDPGTPVLGRASVRVSPSLDRNATRVALDVGIASIATAVGSRQIGNDELADLASGWTSADIMQRTGIEQRYWVGENEDSLSLATAACRQALAKEDLIVDDLDLIICSTTSPQSVAPSTACRVLNELSQGQSNATVQAFDIVAACSGFLYALQSGYDYLQSQPDGRVLIVTTDVLSPVLDPKDISTSIIFGDSASATVLYGQNHFERARARVLRPELSAKGEDGADLSVPFQDQGFIRMNGRNVFREAVRRMSESLHHICQREGVDIEELDLVVPHQANQRIIDVLQNRLDVDVFSNIRKFGNTSSSSIPLCLAAVMPDMKKGTKIGLCAFGAGFTFGAAILEMEK